MGLKVAIVGLSPDTHDKAPFGNPEWQTWGMAWDGDWARLDRVFEMHAEIDPEDYPKGYLERLEYANPVTQANYPLDAVIKTVGRDYFQSSIAYMLALAIHEGAEEIAIFGCSMGDDTDYGYQRANAEYLVGVAVGRGIHVHIESPSALCEYKPEALRYHYPTRYGWAE